MRLRRLKQFDFKRLPVLGLCAVVAFLVTEVRIGAQTASRRPNILFIMSDDHAAQAISSYGSRINKTPNIDRLALEGTRLTNTFVTNSICTPSRAAILTSQYSHVNGVYTLDDPLNPSLHHVAHRLSKAGYQTAIIGKWHLHTDPTGFDYWNVLPGQGRYHDPILKEKGGQDKVHKGHSTDVITDLSITWLKNRQASEPFFLMCHFKAPHRPWDPAEKHAQLYADQEIPEPPTLFDHYANRSKAAANATLKIGEDMTKEDLKREKPPGLSGDALRKWAYQYYIKDYLRCVASVDENVGRLLDFLGKAGLKDNTLVIYTSDQGFFLGEHGYFDKRFMYEESLRMPFLVRYPREIKAGTVNQDMVLNIDFAPTFLDYAGVSIPGNMQGRSIRPLLKGSTPKDWRTSMYYRYWMHLAHHGVPAHYGVRTQRHKLIYYYGQPLKMKGAIDKPTAPEWELFDLDNDPQEMHNLYDSEAYSKVVRELKAELKRLRKEFGDRG